MNYPICLPIHRGVNHLIHDHLHPFNNICPCCVRVCEFDPKKGLSQSIYHCNKRASVCRLALVGSSTPFTAFLKNDKNIFRCCGREGALLSIVFRTHKHFAFVFPRLWKSHTRRARCRLACDSIRFDSVSFIHTPRTNVFCTHNNSRHPVVSSSSACAK